MKRYIFAALAMGAAIALIPCAQADSFSYRTTGSSSIAKSALYINQSGPGTSVANTGVFATSGISETFASRNGGQFNSGNGALKANSAGSIDMFGEAGFAFEGLLNQNATTHGILDRSGVIVDLSGSEVNLLLSAFRDTEGNGAAGIGRGEFGNKGGSRLNEGIAKASGALAAGAATLAATPEPGSLFLLGTGLLCMALVLSRKAARQRSTNS